MYSMTMCICVPMRAYRCGDNSIADALLFDEGMTIQTGIQQTGLRHGIKINTRSRYIRNLWPMGIWRVVHCILTGAQTV